MGPAPLPAGRGWGYSPLRSPARPRTEPMRICLLLLALSGPLLAADGPPSAPAATVLPEVPLPLRWIAYCATTSRRGTRATPRRWPGCSPRMALCCRATSRRCAAAVRSRPHMPDRAAVRCGCVRWRTRWTGMRATSLVPTATATTWGHRQIHADAEARGRWAVVDLLGHGQHQRRHGRGDRCRRAKRVPQ